MKIFDVKNEYINSKLDKIEKIILSLDLENDFFIEDEEGLEEKDYYLSDQYREKIIRSGSTHEGTPDRQPLYQSPTSSDYSIHKNVEKIQNEMIEYMCVRAKCLDVLYPRRSYCSWHNNSDAYGYGLMFSWSETGEGDFRYWDIDKKEVIYIHDKKGWNVKSFYFGNYTEPERLVYHASSNECLRFSMAFAFKEDKDIWEETVDILENEE
jgi:hypothetical protein